MTARQRLEEALRDHGCTVRGNSAQCPGPDHANGDRNPSLSIGDRKDGTGVLISCKAGSGCATDAILEALGMSAADLFDEPRQRGSGGEWTPHGEAVAVYDYVDEAGSLLYQVCRTAGKDFPQRVPDRSRKSGWRWKLGDTRRVLYRLPRVVEAVKNGETVWVCEGEKDVHALEAAGVTATTSGAAGSWRGEYPAFLSGADIIIVADRDKDGYGHAAKVAASLDGKAKSVRVVEAAAGKDAADHLAAGHGLEDFRPCADVPDTSDVPDSDRQDVGGLAAIAARYTPVDWETAWKGQPESVEWLIEPFLEAGTVNALFAKAGTGKSLLALDWALRLARADRTVVYVDDENRVTDVVERLQALGTAPGELSRLLLYSFAGLPALDTIEGGTHLLALAAAAGAELVVLDTTTRMVAGRENDADTFLQLYRCSLARLKGHGITVLRLDHPGKDEDRGQRGSSAKDGDVDTIWKLTEQAKGRKYKLQRTKNRSGHAAEFDMVDVERRYEPLSHYWAVPDRSSEKAAVGQLCGQLDHLRVPPSAGRDRCRTALKDAGISISNDLLSKAVYQRRYAPDSSRTAGQPVLPLPPVRDSATRSVAVADRSAGTSPQAAEGWGPGTHGEAAQ